MAFAVLPPDYQLSRPEVVAFSNYQGVKYGGGLSLPFDVTRRVVNTIRCGRTTYQLRQAAQGFFAPARSNGAGGEFLVEGFPRAIVGTGNSPDEAHRDWVRQFHAAFQQLYVMRPFEMTDAERRTWIAIENLVDVEKYRAEQPLVLLQIGVVRRARPYPQIVQWDDGIKERVSLEQMPGEFAAYKVGQSFEALVQRNPTTYKIVRVEYVKRVTKGAVKQDEAKKLWNSTRTSSDLPDTDWD